MTHIKIIMPTKNGKLVEWESCVIAHREKQKREWIRKRKKKMG